MTRFQEVRYGDFTREAHVTHVTIDYNRLTESTSGVSRKIGKIKLSAMDAYKLLKPYIRVRFVEQLRALLPLALYLVLFQIFILHQPIQDSMVISGGLLAVIIGLMCFMEGIKQGLMPFGELIGNLLPKKSALPLVLGVAFLLGIGVTFAEPAIGALKAAGSLVEIQKAPYLYAMLNMYSDVLVLLVGMGVGLAAVLGTLRFLYGWSLKPYIYIALLPTLGLTLYMMSHSDLVPVLGLAWDSGAVTTGPVTVPLVLALGIGIASAAGKGDSSLSGFGIVTLASLFPIIAVMGLGIYLSYILTPHDIMQMAQTIHHHTSETAWFLETPVSEILMGMRAILPLIIFLFLVLKLLLRERLPHSGTIWYGITLSVLGMIIFNLGLTYGLAKLGEQSGSLIPAAFVDIDSHSTHIEAIYPYWIGLALAFLFAFILGFGATLAEPALNALGMTVENLTDGAFKKSLLMYSVSLGVGVGLTLGIIKIIFAVQLGYLLLPLYFLAVILTYFSTEEFVNIAWDSAGVTTGPITVPLVLAMGLGFGNAIDAIEGFGILSMASICPILSVLTTGIYVNVKARRKPDHHKETHEGEFIIEDTQWQKNELSLS
jgi:hypothetical protein